MWKLKNNKVGLVLGGGGARGYFHVGVIKALQELHIHVDEIAGTSIGAIVGAMWAANPDLNIEQIAKEVNFLEVVRMMIWGSKTNNRELIKKYLKKFVDAEHFEDLKIKLSFNATDINNRKEIIFNKGDLFPGLIAAISVPGFFLPVEYQGKYLVDGGLMNSIPVTLIETASQLIVSDISGPFKKIDGKSRGFDILYSSIALMQQQNSIEKIRSMKDKKITYLHLIDSEVAIMDFRKQHFQRLIDLGYEAVMMSKHELVSMNKNRSALHKYLHKLHPSRIKRINNHAIR